MVFPGSLDTSYYCYFVTSVLTSTNLIRNKGQENWEKKIKIIENCFILQIVKTVSDTRDNALGIFNAIFPSQQERSCYKSCFSCCFHQSLSKTTKAAVIKLNVALVTPPSQQNVTKLEVQ